MTLYMLNNELKKIQWISIKNLRNQLLKDSDWTQLSDSALSENKIKEWKKYRQDLRDIPQNNENPFNIKFPSIPI